MFSDATIPKVLVVEDDHSIRGLLSMAMRREGLAVDAADDGAEALRRCESTEYAVIVLDLMLPVLNGFQFLDALPLTAPNTRPVIFVVTAYDDRIIESLPCSQVHAVVRKPFDVQQLAAIVADVAATWRSDVSADAGNVLPPPRETQLGPAC